MNKSILCGLAAAALWGSSNVLAKNLLLTHFEPMSFLLAEFTGSCILLWAMLALQKKQIVFSRADIKYSLLGLLQPGLAFILGVYGLSLTTANSDSLVWAAETIVIIFLSWLVFRERIGWTIFSLAVCGTIGTILATAPGTDSGQAPSLYLKAIKGLGAARAAIFLVLPPVFTIIGSFFFLGERLNLVQWLGALLALGAVAGLCVLRPEETPEAVLLSE